MTVRDHFKRPAPYPPLPSQSNDCFDIFGKAAAFKLRDLNKTQCILAENIINEMLAAAELGSLTSSHTVMVTFSNSPFQQSFSNQSTHLHSVALFTILRLTQIYKVLLFSHQFMNNIFYTISHRLNFHQLFYYLYLRIRKYWICIHKTYKCTEDNTSRDSDSLIHEYVEEVQSNYCWDHPKVRENWKTVCAAVVLLIVGIGLLGMGAFAVAEPENGLQGAVFFVAGMICFVPGAYHVVYIWLAARGQRGYDFYHLPLFT